MAKLGYKKQLVGGMLVLASSLLIVAIGSYAINESFNTNVEPGRKQGPRQATISEAKQDVLSYRNSVESRLGFETSPQPTMPAPAAPRQSPAPQQVQQASSPRLSDAEQRLLDEAMERQARRAALLEERAWAAANAPLGESIHDPYARAKARRAQKLETETALERPEPQPEGYDSYADNIATLPSFETPRLSASPPDLATGTVMGARLLSDLRSELPGLVRALITTDVFDSQTLRRVVIPRGSQLIGAYDNQTQLGQQRLFLYWTELRLPDGRVIDLEQSSTLDANGASGVTGRRQTGFLTALVQSALIGTLRNATSSAESAETGDLTRAAQIATGQSTTSVAERYLEQQMTRGTRFTVRAGTVLNVVLDRPFWLDGGLGRQGRTNSQGSDSSEPRYAVQGANVDREAITVSTNTTTPRYDRDLYGGWADQDGDCQNTRHEVLELLSTGAVSKTGDGCAVVRGRWLDPYTGEVERVARDLDVDHLVPLAWAHPRGAYAFEPAKKRAFSNDARNLFATKAAVNREKGAKGPLEWLPPNESFQCEYVTRFERIVRIWKLSYKAGEGAAMQALRQSLCA